MEEFKVGDRIAWFKPIGRAKWCRVEGVIVKLTPKGVRGRFDDNGEQVEKMLKYENIERLDARRSK